MSKRLFCVILAMFCWMTGGALAADAPQESPLNLTAVSMSMESSTAGTSNVLVPVLAGHPDAGIQEKINGEIASGLHLEEALRTLERVQAWGEDGGEASGIHMEGRVYIAENLLSLVVSTSGELFDGRIGQAYTTFNYDLYTGEQIQLKDLFLQPEAAISQMEATVSEFAENEGLNAYLEHGDMLPLPREAFSLDARGITVYYPSEQYQLLSGNSGAFLFLYYHVEPMMRQSALCELLLSQRPAPEDPAEQVRRDISAGELPGIQAVLGQPISQYIARYRLVREPDYTLDGPICQFESSLMQGVKLIAPMYPEHVEEGDLGPVIAIRAIDIDLYGLRAGVSTLQDAVNMLGEPDQKTEMDEDTAIDMLLTVGESYWYVEGGNRLEFHANEHGVINTIILHAGILDAAA